MAISPGGRPADDSSLDSSPRSNWVEKVGGLPKYVRMVAHALIRKGMAKDRAIATAVNTIRVWSTGKNRDGSPVSPKVQAAAAAALAEWNAKKGATVSLSTRVDVSELLDLAVPAATLEWALEALEVDELDLAEPAMLDLAREYVRDLVGRFATSGRRDGDRTLEAEVDGEKPKRDLPRNPAAYDVDTIADVRKLVRTWAEVPMTARGVLKARLTAAVARLDAEPRLRALVAGLGDGDGQREKGEGSAAAVRRGDARDWLRKRGVKLSDDDMTVLLDLAEQVLESADDVLDLAAPDVIDLAPGDYKPPYDWKHGFIPLTPAAALSKAKKPPYAGKGAKRGKAAKAAALTPIRNRKPAGTQSVSKASMDDLVTMARTLPDGPARKAVDAELRKRDVSPATVREGAAAKAALEKAKDDEARGRGTPGAVEKAEKAASESPKPKRGDTVKIGSMSSRPDLVGKAATVDRVDRHGLILDVPGERDRIRVNPYQVKVAETGQTRQNGGMTNPTRKTSDTPTTLKQLGIGPKNVGQRVKITYSSGRTIEGRLGRNNEPGAPGGGGAYELLTDDGKRIDMPSAQSKYFGAAEVTDERKTPYGVKHSDAGKADTPKEDPTSSEAKRNPGPRRLTAAEKRKHAEDRHAGYLETAGMTLPELKARQDKLHAEGKIGAKSSDDELLEHQRTVRGYLSPAEQESTARKAAGTDSDGFPAAKRLDAMTPDELTAERRRLDNIIKGRAGGTATDVDVERWRKQRQAVDNELAKRPGRETQARSREALAAAREGDYPRKSDGSPDYGAMSAEQGAKVRAKEAGRGLGDKVSTDRGPGTVTNVSSRSTTIKLDSGDTYNVGQGTFGHERIRPLGKGGDDAIGSTSSNPTDKALRENARNRDDLMSLRWTRDSNRGGVSVSYSSADADKLEQLERDGLIRMDRRGLSAQADDQYVLTDKGKARVSDVDLHQNTQDRARRQLAERDQQAGQRTREQLADRMARKRELREAEGPAGRSVADIPTDALERLTKTASTPERREVAQRELERRNREAAGATDTGKARKLSSDRVLLDGTQYERVVGPNGGFTWRDGRNSDVKDMDTRRKLDAAAPLSGSAVAAQREANNRKTELEGGPSATPPSRSERANFPNGQQVAYNGRPSDGTGVVIGRRTDSQGTILEVRDDKDGETYEWAPEQVKPLGKAKPTAPQAPARPSSSSTNPDAPIRIEHGPDGTVVRGTTREDAAAIKSVGGFKWSRNLNAWYLPRTWGESTRSRRVDQLAEKLGDKAGVDRTTGPRKSAAERDAETRERAAGRAERMEARAERQSAEADRRFEASDLREEKSGIPFGQPILVGHHSERKHRRAIERAQANLGKGVEAQREAERASEAAERARRTASGTESKTTTGNRIKKLEAEQRDIQRKLDGTSSQMRGPATGAYAERLRTRAAEVADELEFNREKLATAGGVPSQDSVSPGDFVKVAGTWYPVQKSNAKSATVPSPMGTGTRTAAWHKVQEVRKAGEVTREEVARMVADVERPFPNLANALRAAAPPADGRSAGSSDAGQTTTPAATPGGITAATAGRMSDEQLERAMSRLMADNNYDGPAFKIIEAELNKRDAARAEGNRPRR